MNWPKRMKLNLSTKPTHLLRKQTLTYQQNILSNFELTEIMGKTSILLDLVNIREVSQNTQTRPCSPTILFQVPGSRLT